MPALKQQHPQANWIVPNKQIYLKRIQQAYIDIYVMVNPTLNEKALDHKYFQHSRQFALTDA